MVSDRGLAHVVRHRDGGPVEGRCPRRPAQQPHEVPLDVRRVLPARPQGLEGIQALRPVFR
eukprot:184517-Heterocapsa_arctica.AAC.1